MSIKRQKLFVLCLAISVVGIAVGTAPVAAQDDVPSLPASYYGELTLTDGDVDQEVQIEAVADGEVQNRIITSASGEIGGPALSDTKLDVQEPDSGTVEFHIGGEPAEIRSLEGTSVNADSIPWDSGGQKIVLETDSEALQPAFGLSITDIPESVESGNEVAAEIEVENEGAVGGSTTVELLNFEQEVVDSDAITVGVGETTTTTLTWETDKTIDTTDAVTIRANDTTVDATVEVARTEPPEIDDPPTGGGQGGVGGGGGAGGPTETGEESITVPMGAVGAEEQTIVSSSRFNLSQVRFSNASVVESVTWEGTRFNGTVKTTTYNQTPDTVSSAPGGVVAVGEITTQSTAATEPATIQLSVTPEQLNETDVTADSVRIYQLIDGQWEAEKTLVIEQSDQKVVLQTEVSQLSFVAVSAVGSPTAAISVQPPTPTAGENVTLTAENTTDQYGEITSYEWTVNGNSLEGETVNTTIVESGEVQIQLTVENDVGKTDTTTESVTVETSESLPGLNIPVALLAVLISAFALRRKAE